MADQLKDFYNARVVESIAADLRRAHRRFPAPQFTEECMDGLDQLELTQRAWHITEAMRRHLPEDFEQAAAILIRSLGEKPDTPELTGMEPFRYLPHVFYVSKYGLDHFETSMQAQYELTQRFTAEFSIRAFLIQHPEKTLARLKQWSTDASPHVRRLVSEGTRTRLPWAQRLGEFQKDPSPVVQLLELLKDDPALYVRRSVANNVNDIAKDHPGVAIAICRRWWKGAGAERQWIVRHALRSLVKQGHPDALAILGFAAAPEIRIENLNIPKLVKLGGKIAFSCEMHCGSTHKSRQMLLIDYRVHFVKANGKAAPKVFKLSKAELAPGGHVALAASVSLKEMTTRKHYPGPHKLELLINGVAFPLGEVQVTR